MGGEALRESERERERIQALPHVRESRESARCPCELERTMSDITCIYSDGV